MAAQLEKTDSTIYSITDIPRIDLAIQTLAQRSMFWRPVYLAQSAWLEHIPFAFWLTEAHRPRVFVELGIHYGVSYFAFCQAVDRLGLDTRCFGIDTFKGDEHAGIYGENVFEQVRSHNELQYSCFSRIVRSSFDDALKHFSDGSIDLLHIDGLHTIEAVRHDFESWLPKLSKRAVIVMHDTNVRERNFGVFKLFEQLKQKYPHFEFVHGHGLGVLGVGEEQNELMQLLFHASDNEHSRQSVHEVFSRLGQACSSAQTASLQRENAKLLKVTLEKKHKQLDETVHSLEKKNADIDSLSKELIAAKETIQTQLQHHVIEREHFVEKAKLFQELRAELKDEVARLQGRLDAAFAELQLKGQELTALIRERNEPQRQIDSMTAQLTERDRSIADLRQEIEEERKESIQKGDLLRVHEEELEKTHSNLQEAYADLEKLREENARQASEFFSLQQTLNIRSEEFNALNETLSVRMRDIDDLKKMIESKDIDNLSLQEKIVQLQSKNEKLARENQTEFEESVKKLADLRKLFEEKDALLQEKNKELKAQEKRLADRFKEISELTKIIGERDLSLKEKDKKITVEQQRTAKLENELKAKMEVAKACEKQLAEIKAQTAATKSKKDAELSQLQAEREKLKNELQVQKKRLEDRFQEIAALTKLIDERDRTLMEKNAELEAEKQRVEKLFNPLMAFGLAQE